MGIELSIDQKGLARFSRFGQQVQKQLPFAVSLALNAVAGGSNMVPGSKSSNIRTALKGATRGYFDKPTTFIQNAWRQTFAKKSNLTVTIYAEEKRVKYLKAHIQGGARTLKAYEAKLLSLGDEPTRVLIPSFVKKNAAGNVTRGTLGKIIQAQTINGPGSVFIGRPRGGSRPVGVYERTKQGSLKPLFVTQSSAVYRRGFPLEQTAQNVVARRFNTYLAAALQQALANAKR